MGQSYGVRRPKELGIAGSLVATWLGHVIGVNQERQSAGFIMSVIGAESLQNARIGEQCAMAAALMRVGRVQKVEIGNVARH
jgi:Transglycosylase associated protein